jgi:hypothetical protein
MLNQSVEDDIVKPILNAEGVPIVPDLTEDKETLLSTLKDSLTKGFEPK